MKRMLVLLAISLTMFSAEVAVGAVNDTIIGTVVDSLSNAGIDSVTVSSEGITVRTSSNGSFNLVIPTTGLLHSAHGQMTSTITWNPKSNVFSWPGDLATVSFLIQDLSGRVAAGYSSKSSSTAGSFSIAGLPVGIYAASIRSESLTGAYKIIKFHAGADMSCAIIPGRSSRESLVKTAATTKPHLVVCQKTGYKVDSVTVPANTSTASPVTIKMSKSAALTVLFDGTSLANWVVTSNCSIKDSAIYITGCWCMMWTKLDYDNFRIFVTCRVLNTGYKPGGDHQGLGIWGARRSDDNPSNTIEFTPQNCWIWDYALGTGPNNASTCLAADGNSRTTDWNSWHTTELLANFKTGMVKTAVDGERMTNYKVPNMSRRSKGPIGLQDHGSNPVEYKDIKIEVDPVDTNLISVK